MVLKELPRDRDLEFPHIMRVKASAGSGKTYILSLRFLQFLLSDSIPDSTPSRILAITFTNNATEEMRRRILRFLKLINLEEKSEVLKKISHITTVKDIKKKAGALLDEILSDFDSFQVRTIDSFVNQIIRASTYELGLPPEYEIVSNIREFIDFSFARLISRVPSDPRIREAFYKFIENDTDLDFKPWEKARKEIEKLIDHEHSFHRTVRSIEVESPEPEDVLNDIADRLEEMLVRGGKNSDKIRDALVAVKSRANLLFILKKLTSLGKKDREELKDGIEKLANLYARATVDNLLTLFDEVKKELEDTKKRTRKIFLSELNRRINDFLQASHPTWIYYKLGETIRHYLIDEFQDTSELQWSNIEPLIENALAGGGSLFFVGDRKQLLYRFRGSSFETFDLPVKRFGHFKTYEIVLDKNWRSRENIIDFVGDTFDFENIKNITSVFTQETMEKIKEVYENVRQKTVEEKKGGRIVVKKGKNIEEFYEWLENILDDVTGRFAYRDIAILLRNNSNVKKTTRFLASKGIPVISSSSLDIRKNYVIRAIKNLLSFLDFPPDNVAFAKFITSPVFTTLTGINFENWLLSHRNLSDTPLYRKFREEFGGIWDMYLDDLFRGVGYYPPYDLIWHTVRKLKIFEKFRDSEAFVQKLLDVVYRLEENGALSLKDILERLEGEDESIFTLDMPVDENAVKVTTIHKAKGLEFEVVITWLNEREKFNLFSIFQSGDSAFVFPQLSVVSSNSELLSSMKKSIDSWKILDHLNTLYVAMTRAKSELYVYFGSFDSLKKLMEDVEVGEPLRGESYTPRERSFVGSHYKFIDWTTNLANTVKGAHELKRPIRRGDFIHRVLSRIDKLRFRPGELMFPTYMKELIKITSHELGTQDFDLEEIYRGFEKFFSKPEIRRFFEGGEVYTEKEIYNARGEHMRIDRLVFLEDRILVVDFKTGEPGIKKYEEQVENYKQVVRELHPDMKVLGYIVYFDRCEVVEV